MNFQFSLFIFFKRRNCDCEKLTWNIEEIYICQGWSCLLSSHAQQMALNAQGNSRKISWISSVIFWLKEWSFNTSLIIKVRDKKKKTKLIEKTFFRNNNKTSPLIACVCMCYQENRSNKKSLVKQFPRSESKIYFYAHNATLITWLKSWDVVHYIC